MAEVLYRYTRELDTFGRDRLAEGDTRFQEIEQRVERQRRDGDIDPRDGLMRRVGALAESGEWRTAEESDTWLSPRLHSALRLTRAEAGDRGLWHWLALRYRSYVEYRWTGDGGVNRDRWFGPVHKQALARLWWGAELFRDGDD